MENVAGQVSASEIESRIRDDIKSRQDRHAQERKDRALSTLTKDVKLQQLRLGQELDPTVRARIEAKIAKIQSEMECVVDMLESFPDPSAPMMGEVSRGEQTPFFGGGAARGPLFAAPTPRHDSSVVTTGSSSHSVPDTGKGKTGRSSMIRYVKRAKVASGTSGPGDDGDDGDDTQYARRVAKGLGGGAGGGVGVEKEEDNEDAEPVDEEERDFLDALAAAAEQNTTVEVANLSWEHGGQPVRFAGGLEVPLPVWHQMFDYQRVCVQWLWELHCLGVGGILADEMGLGKTVEVAVFLGALAHSGLVRGKGAVLVVCPATILTQWVREVHFWAPHLRVSVLHAIGSHTGTPAQLLANASLSDSVVLTTYASVRSNLDAFLSVRFSYIVLDEGHAIRNPHSATAIACKSIPTPHRIMMTGTPIQNKLEELWSLFNFVNPKLLGELTYFVNQFEAPIKEGSYRHATPRQIQIAFEFSRQLRALIAPFILRRMKADVGMVLPPKMEQVLLCKLSKPQVDAYAGYLMSDKVSWRLANRQDQKRAFQNPTVVGKDNSAVLLFECLHWLRKICNHTWMAREGKTHLDVDTDDITHAEDSSGKLKVLLVLLDAWAHEKRKAIVFSQTRMMLDIIEAVLRRKGIVYVRMDGNTPISHRSAIVDALNHDPSVAVGLLTTRVGGLGTNLVGCSRVVVFDPDWNPITDVQARERVWRLGQKNDVLIYRLLSVGTIEEKIYHRQIYKLCQMESILGNDGGDRRLFTAEELTDLFTLGHEYTDMMEPAARHRFGSDTVAGRDLVRCETIQALGGEIIPSSLVPKAEDSQHVVASPSSEGILRGLMDSNSVHSVASHDAIMSRRGLRMSDRLSAQQTAQAARNLLVPVEKPKSIPPQMPVKREE